MKDLTLQPLGKKQINSREDGVPGWHEDQSRTSRLEYAGDGCNRRSRVSDVFQQSLANDQVRIRLPAVLRDVSANFLIIHSGPGSREFILVDIQPYQPQSQPALFAQANRRILAAAYVVNDASILQIGLDPMVKEILVPIHLVFNREQPIERPAQVLLTLG
jgi:hypothetical protein